jgi:hypothetical protein
MDSEKLPGVTLTLISTVLKRAIEDKKKLVEVRLAAKIEDEEVWKAVLEKLKVIRIYTIEDLKSEMVNVLNLELNDEQKKRAELERTIRQLEYERGVLRVEAEESRRILATLRELRRVFVSPST